MIYTALRTYLLTHAGLAALIGTRIYPDEAPQGAALPHVIYINISDVKDHVYGGEQALESPIYQYTAYASTKLGASAVAEQIKAAMKNHPETMSGIKVQYIKLVNELSGLDTSPDGTIKTYTVDLEYEINYERS